MGASVLAIGGGRPAVTSPPGDAFTWPIITREDERAVLAVLRRGAMSGTDVTMAFEREFAAWMGMRYALAYCNGTAAIRAALWASGVGMGDEVICPSLTFWASCTQVLTLGAASAMMNHHLQVRAETLHLAAPVANHRRRADHQGRTL